MVKQYRKKIDSGHLSRRPQDYLPEGTMAYDIETTGLSSRFAHIYCIGSAYAEGGSWCIRQVFAESADDEPALLQDFLEEILPYRYMLSFNGASFDLRFLEEKCARYGLYAGALEKSQIDLYRVLSPMKRMLGLSDMRQKTLERRMGLVREDTFTGGDLIHVYREYQESQEEKLLRELLLHNAEDVEGLLILSYYLAYTALFGGKFKESVPAVESEDDGSSFILPLHLESVLPFSLNYYSGGAYLHAEKCTALLKVPVLEGTLKFFYPNYKDYYYFPEEDQAFHKDVARFTDSSHRKKATAATAYQKKNGLFLPVPAKAAQEMDLPFFYETPKKDLPFVELSKAEEEAFPLHYYIEGILQYLLADSRKQK